MKKPNNIETALNAVRVDFYKKTKGMSLAEMNAYIKAQVAPLYKKHGINPVGKTEADNQRPAL